MFSHKSHFLKCNFTQLQGQQSDEQAGAAAVSGEKIMTPLLGNLGNNAVGFAAIAQVGTFIFRPYFFNI